MKIEIDEDVPLMPEVWKLPDTIWINKAMGQKLVHKADVKGKSLKIGYNMYCKLCGKYNFICQIKERITAHCAENYVSLCLYAQARI